VCASHAADFRTSNASRLISATLLSLCLASLITAFASLDSITLGLRWANSEAASRTCVNAISSACHCQDAILPVCKRSPAGDSTDRLWRLVQVAGFKNIEH
jgi:hypothetical protein